MTAAGPVHRALLPRRGDRIRRRPPAVPRAVLRLRNFVTIWHELHPDDARGRRDRQAAPRRAGRARLARAAAARSAVRRAARRRVRLARRRSRLVLGDRLLRWTPAGYEAGISPASRKRCRADAAVARRGAPGRLAGSGAAAAPVGGSPDDRLKPVAVTPPARCALTSEPGCARDSPRHYETRWSCCRRSSCSRSAERSPAPPGGAQTTPPSPAPRAAAGCRGCRGRIAPPS